jgi:plasmid stabilization system protein ParE
MRFEVRFSPEADNDLLRLIDFLLDRAKTIEDLAQADAAVDAIRLACLTQLSTTPYSFRKADKRRAHRELIIPFGATGYVALFEIVGPTRVLVLAVRHQREQDYH